MISVNQQIQNNNLRPGEKIRDEEMMNIRKKPVCDTKTSYVCLTSCMFFCAFISIPLAMKKHSAAAFAWSSSPVSTVQMWKWGPFWSKGAVNLHKSSTPFPRKKRWQSSCGCHGCVSKFFRILQPRHMDFCSGFVRLLSVSFTIIKYHKARMYFR